MMDRAVRGDYPDLTIDKRVHFILCSGQGKILKIVNQETVRRHEQDDSGTADEQTQQLEIV